MEKMVSIVIPTYGGSDCVKRAVDSCLSQSYSYLEIIVVDDNGEGTESQVKTYNSLSSLIESNKIRYICHEVNKNGSAARNTGVKASTGEYIALLDDDDVLYPDKIKRQVEKLSSLSADYAAVYCSHKTFLNDELIEELHVKKSGNLLYDCLIHTIEIATSSLLIRRDAFESINGFDESFRRHQDWEFVARLCSKYKIEADDFIGYSRILTMRNNPKSPEQAIKFRRFFIEKMEPLLNTFEAKVRKKIIVDNLLDSALWYLKNRDFRAFLEEYKKINPGIYGIRFFWNRLRAVIKRGKVFVVKPK